MPVPVTMRALIQRINRKLKLQDEKLKTARSRRVEFERGPLLHYDPKQKLCRARSLGPPRRSPASWAS